MTLVVLLCAACIVLWPAAVAHGMPTSVAHHGQIQEEQIQWETRWETNTHTTRLPLAYPLPPQSRLAPGQRAVRPETDASGRIVAITLNHVTGNGVIHWTVPQESSDTLNAPLLAGPAIQRVTLSGARFTPDPALDYSKHVSYWAAPGLSGSKRTRFERDWSRSGGIRARTRDQALYLLDDTRFDDHAGVPGVLGPVKRSMSRAIQAGLGGVTLLVVWGGWVLHRSLESQVRTEQNAAYIRSTFGGD